MERARPLKSDPQQMRSDWHMVMGWMAACYPTLLCGRYTLTIDKSTIEKRFGDRFYIAQQEFEPSRLAHEKPALARTD